MILNRKAGYLQLNIYVARNMAKGLYFMNNLFMLWKSLIWHLHTLFIEWSQQYFFYKIPISRLFKCHWWTDMWKPINNREKSHKIISYRNISMTGCHFFLLTRNGFPHCACNSHFTSTKLDNWQYEMFFKTTGRSTTHLPRLHNYCCHL